MRTLLPRVLDELTSLNTDGATLAIQVLGNEILSYQAVVTNAASLNGELFAQGSGDGVNWFDLDQGSFVVDRNDVYAFVITKIGYRYSRLRWDRVLGSGAIEILYTAIERVG